MGRYEIINLDEELQELFSKEEMLALFDFELLANGRAYPGLCRISKAKGADPNSRYFSFIFIVDSSDSKEAAQIKSSMSELSFERLCKTIPGITKETSFTNPQSTSRHCYYELYLYFDASVASPEDLLAKEIYPAIKERISIKAGTLTFWNK